MADGFETLRGILPRLERLAAEIKAARMREMRRSSFEDLCSRYNILAEEAGRAMDCSFPARKARLEDFGLAVGLGKPAILVHDEKAAEGRVPSDLLAWEYVPYDGKKPKEEDWLEHFGIVFEGTRGRAG